nr:cobalt transporter CbiM [Campylobacter sp.]
MHISEGVLKPEIIIPASILSVSLAVYLIYKLKPYQIPKIACMSAIFFVASFIHIPIGATSVHLILSGFVGAVLGVDAFLAIFIGLLLQAVFFAYGGISVLGVNAIIIGFPAILAIVFVRLFSKNKNIIFLFLAGFVPILLSSFLLSLVLVLNGDEFIAIAKLAFVANSVLSIIEGIIAFFGLQFIYKVNKDILK